MEGTTNPEPAPAPTPAPQFALAPTLHPQQAGFIDYGTKEGQKLFEITSASLGTERKFDGKSDQINIFKQTLKERADFAGWLQGNNDIINIPTGNGAETKNLIEHYGVITNDMINDWANANIVNKSTRAAQNNYAMYKCLSESISEHLKNAIVTKGVTCSINGNNIAALLFEAIMNESEINTVATISTIQLQLSRLNEVILNEEIAGNIIKFNQYVKNKVRELTCRGATYSDLILNLFHAYSSVIKGTTTKVKTMVLIPNKVKGQVMVTTVRKILERTRRITSPTNLRKIMIPSGPGRTSPLLMGKLPKFLKERRTISAPSIKLGLFTSLLSAD